MQENISILCSDREFAKQVAGILAERLEMQFIDIFDMMMFDDKPHSFKEILALRGEAGVRAHEKSCLKYACSFSNTIIVCETGVIEDEDNIRQLHKNSVIVYIHNPARKTFEALQNVQYDSQEEKDFFAKDKKVIDMRISLCKQNCDILANRSQRSPIVVASTVIRYLQDYAQNL